MKAIGLNNKEITSFLAAMGTGLLMMVVILFIPRETLEIFLGSVGISKIIPAVAAPFGDVTHAIIAFTVAVAIFAALLAVQLRMRGMMPGGDAVPVDDPELDGDATLSSNWFGWTKLSIPKWRSLEDDEFIAILGVPKLRANDAHPDAPPRRPVFAYDELQGANLVGPDEAADTGQPAADPLILGVDDMADDWDEPLELVNRAEADFDEAISPVKLEVISPDTDDAPVPLATEDGGSLAEMVAQLEASVEQRKAQLAQLEIVAAKIAERKMDMATDSVGGSAAEPGDEDDLPPLNVPPLTAVPSTYSVEEENEMDAALDAALQTLNRMNSRG